MSSKSALAALAVLLFAVAGGQAGAAEALTVVNPASSYPEGPVAVGEVVYYAEMGSDRVLRWDGVSNTAIWSRSGCLPTSVARGSGDSLIVLCHGEGALVRIGPDGKELAVLGRQSAGNLFDNERLRQRWRAAASISRRRAA